MDAKQASACRGPSLRSRGGRGQNPGVAARSFAKIAKEFRALPRANKPVGELFGDAVRLARSIVPCDGWGALTLDPATLLVTGGVHEHGLESAALERWFELEVTPGDYLHYRALTRELTPVANLLDATRGEPAKSARYRDVLEPAGYRHELRSALRSMKQTWGGLFLLRRADGPAFEPEEESFMRELSEALGEAVRATLRASNAASDSRAGRALLLLGENLEILEASRASAPLLEELSEGKPDPGGLPHTVRTTANGARRGAERGAQVSAYVRVRSKSGGWLTVHASLLGDGKVVVTVEEGRPIGLPAEVQEAYDLSPLQGELLRDALLGTDDAHIAERVGITEAAVAAELATVVEKLGVSQRDELARKVFFEHYAARTRAQAPLGADGWFAA
jgi:GAF domain-containing protein